MTFARRRAGQSPPRSDRRFTLPDYFRSYDKTGAAIMIAAIKYAYFGSESYRMTQKRMEEFFDNPNNFVFF